MGFEPHDLEVMGLASTPGCSTPLYKEAERQTFKPSRIYLAMVKRGKFYTRHVIEKDLRHHILEWIATAMSLVGVFLVAQQMRVGFGIWFFANILWVWFSYKHKHYGLLFLSACYLIINGYGFLNWG